MIPYSDYRWDRGALRQADLTVAAVYDRAYLDARYVAIDDKVRELSRARLEFIGQHVPQGRLLDFGCGTGRLMDEARAIGWDAHGYDAIEPFNVMPAGPWECMTFFDSLEHLADPAATIRQLDPEWLCVSVPECHFPDRPEWFMAWKHRRPGEHLWHWNRAGLKQFMFGVGYREVAASHFEDAWRPPSNPDEPNILTAVYQRAPQLPGVDWVAVDHLAGCTSYTNHSLGHLLWSLTYGNRISRAVEIGYAWGYSASWICAGIADQWPRPDNPVMVSVDLHPCDGGQIVRDQGRDFHRFIQSGGPDSVDQVMAALDHQPVELLFIDGDHDAAEKDFRAYKNCLADNAIVLFHDSYHPPIAEAMRGTGLRFVDLGAWGRLAAGRKAA